MSSDVPGSRENWQKDADTMRLVRRRQNAMGGAKISPDRIVRQYPILVYFAVLCFKYRIYFGYLRFSGVGLMVCGLNEAALACLHVFS